MENIVLGIILCDNIYYLLKYWKVSKEDHQQTQTVWWESFNQKLQLPPRCAEPLKEAPSASA